MSSLSVERNKSNGCHSPVRFAKLVASTSGELFHLSTDSFAPAETNTFMHSVRPSAAASHNKNSLNKNISYRSSTVRKLLQHDGDFIINIWKQLTHMERSSLVVIAVVDVCTLV